MNQPQRTILTGLMDWLIIETARVHYAEVRPMVTRFIHTTAQLRAQVNKPAGVTMDCSESVTLLCKLAGMLDPNGRGYDGTGNTATMLATLPHYTNPAAADVGALCVFLSSPSDREGQHVAMVRQPGADPMLWTHGSEQDPSLHRLSWMASGWPSHVFLNVSHL